MYMFLPWVLPCINLSTFIVSYFFHHEYQKWKKRFVVDIITCSFQFKWGCQIFGQVFWSVNQILWLDVRDNGHFKVYNDASNTSEKKK